MGQANSAQREPSMEEILASIRKIIEETDGTPPEETAQEAPAAPPAEAESAEKPTAEVSGESEVSAFRDAIQDGHEEPSAETETAAPEAAPEPEAQPYSLADVQRRLMRERDGDEPRPAPEAPAEPEASSPVLRDAVEPDETGAAEPATDETEDEVMFAAPEVDSPAEEPEVVPAVEAAEPEAPRPAVSEPASAGPAHAEPASNRPAIISAEAGRQVAGAFDELKEAFMASRKRSFDEMAEEMLRPMLQDWLDNNLPLLVERLVREEIERIARGD